jgi:hypothetical protein
VWKNDCPVTVYTNWHWGIGPAVVSQWPDEPDGIAYPFAGRPDSPLVECGRLVELHIFRPGSMRAKVLKLSSEESNETPLVFDPAHPYRRLYILTGPKLRERTARFHSDAKAPYRINPLAGVAAYARGRHATPDYHDIDVRPLGVLTHVVYATHKKGDGPSMYIHEFGEDSGIQPALCVDRFGRLWIAGGNYTSPDPGITD